jgi:AGZA family xanthine/uracil permease-like MFS transporter
MLERHFALHENGTTARTEIVAGATTFLTMAYIIFVNPSILSASGMDKGAVFGQTQLSQFVLFGPAIFRFWPNR